MKRALLKTTDRPFGLPEESIEIVLDLPYPPSTNKLWRYGNRGVFKSINYVNWLAEADATTMELKQYPKRKIHGPFAVHLALSEDRNSDGDNAIKAALDWCQSRDLVRNDRDCRKGSWEFVSPEYAPRGLRLTLRSLHG